MLLVAWAFSGLDALFSQSDPAEQNSVLDRLAKMSADDAPFELGQRNSRFRQKNHGTTFHQKIMFLRKVSFRSQNVAKRRVSATREEYYFKKIKNDYVQNLGMKMQNKRQK